MTSKQRKLRRPKIPMPRPPERPPNRARATCPAIPRMIELAKKTKKFGELLERPPESNLKLKQRSSIPCGPEKIDRVSSFLVDKGFRVDRAELLFSLIRRLCKEDDERPIEVDDKSVWLGSEPIGVVMGFMEKPTLQIWVDHILTTSYRNGSMDGVHKDLQHILKNTRALAALVDAFEMPYALLASTISQSRFAALIADPEMTCIKFYAERSEHPTRIFRARI